MSRARRVSCKLCGARGSVRNKMEIHKSGKIYFLCLGDAKGIAETFASLPRQDTKRVPPQAGRLSVPRSGDANEVNHALRG